MAQRLYHWKITVGEVGSEILPEALTDHIPSSTGIEPAVVDPAVYGYGGAKWRDKFHVMLTAAEELNLTIDFALGPTQGASVPILDPDSPGMNTELIYGVVGLTAGQHFAGALPQPVRVDPGYANAPDFYAPFHNFTNKFVAAVVARKSNSKSLAFIRCLPGSVWHQEENLAVIRRDKAS